jgi:hypothetical protein
MRVPSPRRTIALTAVTCLVAGVLCTRATGLPLALALLMASPAVASAYIIRRRAQRVPDGEAPPRWRRRYPGAAGSVTARLLVGRDSCVHPEE